MIVNLPTNPQSRDAAPRVPVRLGVTPKPVAAPGRFAAGALLWSRRISMLRAERIVPRMLFC